MSHPIRVRGLKQTPQGIVTNQYVAPYTGAWIETQGHRDRSVHEQVAPYTGAWIETNQK